MPYFVTIVRDGFDENGRPRMLSVAAGPFETEAEADAAIQPVIAAAYEVDRMTFFDLFGVTFIPGRGQPGVLNTRLGLPGRIELPAPAAWVEGPHTYGRHT